MLIYGYLIGVDVVDDFEFFSKLLHFGSQLGPTPNQLLVMDYEL